MQAVTVNSDLMRGFFNTTTAQEVGVRLLEMLGEAPFMVFTKANRTTGVRVLRLVGGEHAVSCHPEAVRSSLVLTTDHGYAELRFGLSEHHRDITYRFTDGNLVIEDTGRPYGVTVVMPLRPPRPQAGQGLVMVPNREYVLYAGNVDQVANELTRRLVGRTVVFANPDMIHGLDHFRFPLVKAVWVGQGYDDRLILEVEGRDVDGTDLEDHIFPLGGAREPNALGENVAVTFFSDRNIQLLVHPKNSMYQHTFVYWPLPC